MSVQFQGSEISIGIIPFNEGLLGNLPLLGRFQDGFLDHRAKCEDALIQARAQSEDSILARTLLDFGIISMLQGELVSAVDRLLEAADKAKNGLPAVRVMALSYAVHCRTMQYLWAPNGSNVISDELSSFFDYQKQIPPLLEGIAIAKQHSDYEARYNISDILAFHREVVSARPVTPTSDHLALSRRLGIPQVEARIASLQGIGIEGDFLVGMLIELAWLYRAVGNRSQFEQSLETARKQIQERSALAAHLEMRLGDDKATSYGTPETWDTVLEQGTESNAQPRDEETLHFMGGDNSDTHKAIAHYEKAQEIFESLGVVRGVAAIQLRLGYVATLDTLHDRTPGDSYRKSLEHIILAESLYHSCGDSIGVQTARAHSCLCRIGVGQEPEDTELARSIGAWGRNHGSTSFAFGLGLFFAKYGRRWLVKFGDYERAVAAHRLAEALFHGLSTRISRLFSITDQLAVYEALGERNRFTITAEDAFILCSEMARSQEVSVSAKAVIHGVQIMSRMFLWAQKRAEPDEMERVATRMQAIRPTAKGGTTFSLDHFKQQYFAMAKSSLHEDDSEGVEQSRVSPNSDELAKLLREMEDLALNPLEFQTKSATAMIDHMVSLAGFQVPFYQGRRAAKEGDQEGAEKLWKLARASLEKDPNELAEVLLVSLCVEMKNYDEALTHTWTYYKQCVASHDALPKVATPEDKVLMDRGFWQSKNQVLGMLTRIRSFEEAAKFAENIQEQWGENWWKIYEERAWENLSLMGQINDGIHKYELACDYYEHAMQAFEERRDQLSVDDYKLALAGDSNVQEIYFGAARSAVKWYLSSHQNGSTGALSSQLQRAFAGLERGKARSLLDLIGGGTLSHGSNQPQTHNQWSAYKQQTALLTTRRAMLATAYSSKEPPSASYINQLKEDVTRQEQQLWKIGKRLSESEELGFAPMTATRVTDLRSICPLLVEGTAILQYAYQRDDLIAWVITKRGMVEVHHITLPEALLERNIHAYHHACESLMSDVGGYAAWLGKTLLPFNSLKEYTRLIIIAYRALHLVPFHALPWEHQPLIKTHSVSYLPSASLLEHLGEWKKLESPFRVFAIGNPSNMSYKNPQTGTEETMRPLPSSEIEARQLARIVPDSKALFGDAATSKAVYSEINNYSVLHFGAHGTLSAAIPMLSSIHLARGTQITVDQLMGRDLEAKLVVLSACETGRGKITDGEDVVGFGRALLAAGVKHVVVSLWPVDDEATCYLMEQFYRNLMQEMTLAEALGAAQLALYYSKKEDIQAYLVELKKEIESESKDSKSAFRGESSDPRGGLARESQRRPVKDYVHPKFWAPFICIGAQ